MTTKLLCSLFVIILLNVFAFNSFSQDISKAIVNENAITKNYEKRNADFVEQPIISITKVSTNNNVVTYSIVNDKIKNELYYNAEKRDALTALPGFVELGINTDDSPMRVVIDSKYADEYINKYFRATTTQTTNN